MKESCQHAYSKKGTIRQVGLKRCRKAEETRLPALKGRGEKRPEGGRKRKKGRKHDIRRSTW